MSVPVDFSVAGPFDELAKRDIVEIAIVPDAVSFEPSFTVKSFRVPEMFEPFSSCSELPLNFKKPFDVSVLAPSMEP